MHSLNYSLEAKNVKNRFYGVDKLVYVEGDDDIPFWEVIFEKLANFSVKIEPVGGKPQLIKILEEVNNENAKYILAMDSDYDSIFKPEHSSKVIKTYGYSIENTIICLETIT